MRGRWGRARVCYNARTMQAIHWLADSLAGNLIGIALGLVVAAMLGYLKERASSIRWALSGFLLVIGIWAGFHCISYFSYASEKVKPLVTEGTVQDKVEDWLLTFGADLQRVPLSNTSDAFFSLKVTARGAGRTTWVQRLPDKPHYLLINGAITLGPEEQLLRRKLSKQQLQELDLELQAEMARAKIAHQPLEGADYLVDGFIVERRIPITGDLSEDVLMQRFEEVNYDILVANSTIVLGLRRKVHEAQSPN